jgi:branched-chain amino acid transport system permease protein
VGRLAQAGISSEATGVSLFGHEAFSGLAPTITRIAIVNLGLPAGLGLLLSGSCLSPGGPDRLSTLRLRGAYFAIATWAFGELLRRLRRSWTSRAGLSDAAAFLFEPPFFYYVTSQSQVAVPGHLSPAGGHPSDINTAIREHEEAAEMVGVDTVSIKRSHCLERLLPESWASTPTG